MEDKITYENPPADLGIDPVKPAPLANKSFPYNDLADDRRFEELLYNLLSVKIKSGGFNGFDNVSLMSGVREKGRDCALLKGGKNHGLIQCKKYKNNLGKQVFGEEITKFVMYSLLFPELIAERDNFTYYIAVSTGFVLECSDFIDDINALILNEPDVISWIAKNLRQPTLAPLKLENIEDEVRDILSRIKVEKLYPQDLDGYLYEPACLHLQPLFFEVRVLIDNGPVKELTKAFNDFAGGSLAKDQISAELLRGSFSLKFEKNEFDDIPGSHIIRQETADLLSWVTKPAAKNEAGKELNICLLAGNAGMGKTVILKDLYDELASQDIPVLGLKADKLYAASITELQEKIGLPVPVFHFIEQCKQNYRQVILLIDQIDALSQSMSADRNFLTVYRSLIDNYLHDPNVRIIVSVRIFDLHYDPSLRVYKDIKTFLVGLLDEQMVFHQLAKIGIERSQVSSKLLQLLRVPNQLNIFARIAPSFNAGVGINNIQDLYTELWKQKVIVKPRLSGLSAIAVKQLLFKAVKEMFKVQRIVVSEHHFENSHAELTYLESELLIKKEGSQLQFFHQTFYDFVFANRFVEKEQDLVSYVKKQGQSIMIRSAVKMILNYLREYDADKYLSTLDALLTDPEIYYHIKHMIISMLAFIDQPSEKEAALMVKFVNKSVNLTALFFEQATSREWFRLSINSGMLAFLLLPAPPAISAFDDISSDPEKAKHELGYRRHTARNFLSRFVGNALDDAWNFIDKVKDPAIIRSLLYDLQNWENPRAYQLLETCTDFMTADPFGYTQILEKIAQIKPAYAWSKIKKPLISDAYADKSSEKDYQEVRVLKVLAQMIPEKMIGTLFKIVRRNLQWDNPLGRPLIGDYSFTKVDLQDTENLFGQQYLYRLLAICLRRAASKNSKEFAAFLAKHKTSRHKAVLRLIIFGLRTNEEKFANDVYDFFCYLRDIGYLVQGGDFSFEFRELFADSFIHFTDTQKTNVLYVLKNLVNKQEAYVTKAWEKPHLMLSWGLGKYTYLSRLPDVVFEGDGQLKRTFYELRRKYGIYQDKSSLGATLAGIVRNPVSSVAYPKMSKDQWIKSFRKYSGHRNPFDGDFLKGGIDQHSWAFKEAASKAAGDKMIAIVRAIIPDNEIPVVYAVMGLWGLAEGQADTTILIELFKQLLHQRDCNSEMRHLVSIAKHLVGFDTDDPEIVQFLIVQSENYEDLRRERPGPSGETGVNGLITRGINTIHGSAAQTLVYIKDPRLEDKIFTAIGNILRLGPMESRAALYFRLAYLNNLNKERAYHLFISALNSETDIYVIASSIWSLQFMGNHDFANLKPVYDKLVVATNPGQDDTHWLFSILYFSYLFDKEGAKALLYTLLDHNEKSRSWALREVSKYYYFNEDSAAKSHPVLMHLIKSVGSESEDKMQLGYLQLDGIRITDIADFIEAYIDSTVFVFSHSLVKYLTRQCSTAPFECIALFERALEKVKPTDNSASIIRENEDFTKFIVGAFSALKGNDAESANHRKKLLQSFDTILKDYRFRANTERVLEDLL